MEINQEKAWIAKIIGACYFILLGFVYTVMQLVSGKFSLGDLGVMFWVCLPLLINRRWLYLVFGGLNLAVWFYAAMRIITISPDDKFIFMASSVIAFGSVMASFLLIFSAVNISEKKFNLI